MTNNVYDIQIQELSGKVLVIHGNHLLNQDGMRFWTLEFEKHGFKVIWLYSAC